MGADLRIRELPGQREDHGLDEIEQRDLGCR